MERSSKKKLNEIDQAVIDFFKSQGIKFKDIETGEEL